MQKNISKEIIIDILNELGVNKSDIEAYDKCLDQKVAIIEEKIKDATMKPKQYVTKDILYDWYISSVDDESSPRWTEKHIDELLEDFDVILKDKNNVN